MGIQPFSARVPVLQNHVELWRLQSNGRNRHVPSGNFETNPCVPPPSMCPPPTTPSTENTRSGRPSCLTVNVYRRPDAVGMTMASRNLIGVPLNAAMTLTSLACPPALPCVDARHAEYCCA